MSAQKTGKNSGGDRLVPVINTTGEGGRSVTILIDWEALLVIEGEKKDAVTSRLPGDSGGKDDGR